MNSRVARFDLQSAEPERGAPLADVLFERLSEAIVSGEFAAGSKLSEPRLAARFGVSRGSLREAIRKLEERKLVTRSLRQGVRVIVPTRDSVIELFEIREVLEGLAARAAARRRTPDEIEQVRVMLAQHSEALSGPDARAYSQASANTDFHFLIARIAGNGRLFDLLCGEYYTILKLYRAQHRIVPGRAQRALMEHGRIVDAIADGDGELAELLMRRHITAARAGIEKNICEAGRPSACLR
jgi:DNA-binding GntR family transcriptional regulator